MHFYVEVLKQKVKLHVSQNIAQTSNNKEVERGQITLYL